MEVYFLSFSNSEPHSFPYLSPSFPAYTVSSCTPTHFHLFFFFPLSLLYSLLNFLEHDFTIDSNHATEFRTGEANGNLGGHGSADEEPSPDQGFGLQGPHDKTVCASVSMKCICTSICYTYMRREAAYCQVCWEETFTSISQINTIKIVKIAAISGQLQKSFGAKKVF